MYKKQKQDSKTTRWKPEKSHHKNAIPYKRVEKYKSNWMDNDFRF